MRRFTHTFLFLCFLIIICIFNLSSPCCSQPEQENIKDNEELKQLYNSDQADRINSTGHAKKFNQEIIKRDKQRRERVRQIIEENKALTANDFFYAAVIYQHGDTPDDYLKSHILASIAGFKGNPTGKSLSALSLDRYLLSIKKPQIFGSQFVIDDKGCRIREPYNNIFEDLSSIRNEYCLPPMSDYKIELEDIYKSMIKNK